MKTEGVTSLLQIDKENLKKLIAEVKDIVSTIIDLPKEKEISFERTGGWSGRNKKK
jgi:hypothetical protein